MYPMPLIFKKWCWIVMQNVISYFLFFYFGVKLHVLWDVSTPRKLHNCNKHICKPQSFETSLSFFHIYMLECEHMKSSISIHMLQRIILRTQGWERALNRGPRSECLRKEAHSRWFLLKKKKKKDNEKQSYPTPNWHSYAITVRIF